MHFSPIIGAMQMHICLLTVVFEVTVLARFDKVLQGSFTQISQSCLTSILTSILTPQKIYHFPIKYYLKNNVLFCARNKNERINALNN
jgi:hypothetical protein